MPVVLTGRERRYRRAKWDGGGISYLMNLINAGVVTALTPCNRDEILALTGTSSLEEALGSVRATVYGG